MLYQILVSCIRESMSRCRQYIPVPGTTTAYHLVMRANGGQMLFGPADKECFVHMLHKVAAFSGVEVLNYCMMSNHYHLLVRVYTRKSEEHVAVGTLLKRYETLYGNKPGRGGGYPTLNRMKELLESGEGQDEGWRDRLEARMDDVSEFLKTLNQRYVHWYNNRHVRYGTLWAERPTIVVVENIPSTLSIVSAYLDLNPVRAGIVEDPGEYRWCGYAAALGGVTSAQEGIAQVMGEASWKEGIAPYRMILFGRGQHGREGEHGKLSADKLEIIKTNEGVLGIAEQLRCRLSYLCRGAFLGSKDFVEHWARVRRELTGQTKRPRHPGSVSLLLPKKIFALRHWRHSG